MKPFCHNVNLSGVTMLAYRVVMVLVQYLTPLCIISFAYARMALRLWGSRAPGIAQESRDANLMRNKKKVSPHKHYSLRYSQLCDFKPLTS
jgi:leucokinin receptor